MFVRLKQLSIIKRSDKANATLMIAATARSKKETIIGFITSRVPAEGGRKENCKFTIYCTSSMEIKLSNLVSTALTYLPTDSVYFIIQDQTSRLPPGFPLLRTMLYIRDTPPAAPNSQ